MKKVLIANRGEIAVRVIRACRDLGLHTVAVYSQADSEALHVLHADEAICIGQAQAKHSYLKIPHILAACEITGADAIHPGYGFLSESADFASICEKCGIAFIGPTSHIISVLGDKARAKTTAKKAGCPIVEGSDGPVPGVEQAKEEVRRIGFPVMIKAVAGGGGKGIRIVEREEELEKQFLAAKTEAEASFGNPDVYIEKVIAEPRHIEIQILGDKWGNIIHLGERDCSVQRRRQKLIEETPSPVLDNEVREEMGRAAVKLAKEVGYVSAGTVEFLLDSQQRFYFMEVNTRIQVEHTVTEEVTGIDLVKQQLRVAMGEKLPWKQDSIRLVGSAMQFRINAEDPDNGFMPSPGTLKYYCPPGGPGVRVDSACYVGSSISPHYDSLLAKLIIKGISREETLEIARRALTEFYIGGVKTTIPLYRRLMFVEAFTRGSYDLRFLDAFLQQEEAAAVR